MADDDVQVTFGAKIDELVAGVKAINDHLGTIKDKASEVSEHSTSMFTQISEALRGITNPIQGIKAGLGEVAEAFVATFAIEKILSFYEGMAELATQTQRTATMLGISVGQVAGLDLAAKATGGSIDGLAMVMSRLNLNLSKGAKASADFRGAMSSLGLEGKELAALPLNDQLGEIAEKFSTMKDGAEKDSIALALLGRYGMQLLPVFNGGKEAMQEFNEMAARTGANNTEALNGFQQTHHVLLEMNSAFTGLSLAVGNAFRPAFEGAIQIVTSLIERITNAVNTSGLFKTALDYIVDALQGVISALAIAVAVIEGLWQIGVTVTTALGDSFRALGSLIYSAMTFNLSGVQAAWHDLIQRNVQDVMTGASQIVGIYNDLSKQLTTIWNNQANAMAKVQQTVSGKLVVPNDSGDSAAMKAMDGQIKILQAGLATKKALYDIDAAANLMSENQKLAAVRAATDQENAAEIAAMQKTLATANLNAEQRKTIDDKISVLKQKHITEDLQFDLQAIQAATARYQEFFNALSSSFNGQLRGLLAGTTSWSAAFKSIMGDMVIFFIEAVEKMVIKWIIGKLAMTAADKSTQVAATAAAAASTAASEVTALAMIQQKVGEVYAGAAAFFAPLLGPGAPAAAAGVAAEVDTAATALTVAGSAEQGAYEVQAGLWQLHDNETVLPAPAAQAFRDMAEGNGSFGGGALHLHGTLIDGPSIARFFKQNAGLQAKYLSAKASISPG